MSVGILFSAKDIKLVNNNAKHEILCYATQLCMCLVDRSLLFVTIVFAFWEFC